LGGDSRPLVPVLVGPTAVGKTAVAEALARCMPVTIICADSRQVYRGLDVGTAKPGAALRQSVRHEGLDLVDPGERYSAGRFAEDAAGWIAAALERGETPVVVGGTGFYVRALADGLFREPPLEPARRDALRAWAKEFDARTLADWAGRLDPAFSGGGRQRAARAVEVALLTGRPLSWWQQAARAEGVMRPWYVRLTLPRAALARRIEDRAREMVAHGLIEEVRGLLARGVAPDAPGLDGVGYREVVTHLVTGTIAAADLPAAIAAATRKYAKRQETWFRHQLQEPEAGSREPDAPVWTLDASDPPDALARRIHERWRGVSAPGSRLTALNPLEPR
jgi:tRNA dimethylallyltransferase